MKKVLGLLGVFGLAFALAGTARAAVILDGSTQPKNLVPLSGLQGIVNAAVYSLDAGAPAADPYGAGVSKAALLAAGFSGAGTDAYLYLYQTDSTGSLEVSQNTVAWTPVASFGQLKLTSFSSNPLAVSVAGDPSLFTPGPSAGAILTADATAVSVLALLPGSSSLQANYGATGLTTGQHSDVWGYTSNFAPQLAFTGIQDGGTNAEGIVPTGVAVPVPAAIWGGLGLLGALFTAKVTRRK